MDAAGVGHSFFRKTNCWILLSCLLPLTTILVQCAVRPARRALLLYRRQKAGEAARGPASCANTERADATEESKDAIHHTKTFDSDDLDDIHVGKL